MSEDIDWDKILHPEKGEERPPVKKEQLFVKMAEMSNSHRYSRWNYLGVVVSIILTLGEVVMLYGLETAGASITYSLPVIFYLLVNWAVRFHYLSLITALRKLATGET